MSEAKKEFHLRLKHDSADFKVGQDIRFEADASTISSIVAGIGTVATSLGVNRCLALGRAAAGALSIYLIGKIIYKNWPYAKLSGVKENNVIQVSVRSEKEKTFDDLIKRKELQEALPKEFEYMKDNLREFLKEEEYKTYGNQVLDIIRKIRVASITQISMDVPDGAINQYIAPGAEFENEQIDVDQLAAAKSGERAINLFVAQGAKVNQKLTGVTMTALAGFDDVEKIRQTSKIEVAVSFDPLAKRFKKKFKASDTIEDVRVALLEDKTEEYQILNKHTREIIDDDLTVEQARNKGLLNKLLAVKKEK